MSQGDGCTNVLLLFALSRAVFRSPWQVRNSEVAFVMLPPLMPRAVFAADIKLVMLANPFGFARVTLTPAALQSDAVFAPM